LQSGKRQPEFRLTVFLTINAFEFYISTGLVRNVKHNYSRMKIITYENIEEAAACLRNGGLVAFPTETVYGLGANALDPMAVARIFEAKKRPAFDPLIVHISDIAQLESLYALPVDPLAYKLAEIFMPGPLTIVHRKSDIVPRFGNFGYGHRGCAHACTPVSAKNLIAPCKAFRWQLRVQNLFGQLSPTKSQNMWPKQGMEIDYLLAGDDQENMVGIESTVVLVANGICTVLRRSNYCS